MIACAPTLITTGFVSYATNQLFGDSISEQPIQFVFDTAITRT